MSKVVPRHVYLGPFDVIAREWSDSSLIFGQERKLVLWKEALMDGEMLNRRSGRD